MWVTNILALLGAGTPCAEILLDFPDLEADDIFEALNCAAMQMDRPSTK